MTSVPGLEHWMGLSFFVGLSPSYATRPVFHGETLLDVAEGLISARPSLAPSPMIWSSLCMYLFLLAVPNSCFV